MVNRAQLSHTHLHRVNCGCGVGTGTHVNYFSVIAIVPAVPIKSCDTIQPITEFTV